MITEEKKTSKKRIFKILIALILIICVVILAQFAWAKYMTSLNGNSKADIAKWSFKVNKETNESFTINLSTTRGEKQEAEVQDEFIGPGTSGEFIIEVDATDTEVSLEYNINMAVDYNDNTVFPQNLIFYYDEGMKNAIYHTENGIMLNGFIAQSDENKTISHTVYWKWDFETGQTQTDKDKNDIADSYWIGQNISIPITVIGQQVNQNPTTNQYAVTFDANGGIIEEYGNSEKVIKTVTCNEEYGKTPIPTKDGYVFDGYYLTKNDYLDVNYRAMNFTDVKRFYLADNGTNNGWSMTNEDIGKHIQARFHFVGNNIIEEPKAVEFNDLELIKGVEYYIYGEQGNWIVYVDFEITETMLARRDYKGQTYDYATLRLLDIEGKDYGSSDAICTIDYFIIGNKRYYDSKGNLIATDPLTTDTTIYAKWIAK